MPPRFRKSICCLFLLIIVLIILFLFFSSYYENLKRYPVFDSVLLPGKISQVQKDSVLIFPKQLSHKKDFIISNGGGNKICLPLETPDISTSRTFSNLRFNGDWINRMEYWSPKFESRYNERRQIWEKLPLRVFIVPHSHNDPGWLKTFESYFSTATNKILNLAVDKLMKYKQMTFIWTEMSFLQLWWETAHSARKENLKMLIKEGRFEIPTGGWVMTDEATVHVYAMLDQLIEGHQWLNSTFGVSPKTSWSVDPFGHGATFPYLLKKSGIDSMLIMRIHYAWKEWFARHQNGDFKWVLPWNRKEGILCHNFPYDIYSIKGSCGPSSQICLGYNFRKISGEFNEYTARYNPIQPSNVQERAELLLEQYGKTGSLLPHNVVLVPLGDDFVYNHDIEWDQQYTNYKMLMDYINSNFDIYHANISFGTVSDYFNAVKERMSNFPTLTGDFFVYSDIFSEGAPAYWSGYYTTRPFMKQFAREMENNLRAAEILFTIAYNFNESKNVFESLYSDLISARRSLALFQHHDAITGTSKQYVMQDYGNKMFDGYIKSRKIQKKSIQMLMGSFTESNLLVDDFQRSGYSDNPIPSLINLKLANETLIVFNSLTRHKIEIISFFTTFPNTDNFLCIFNPSTSKNLPYQINPTWNRTGTLRLDIHFVEVVFLASLPPLSISKFVVNTCSQRHFEKTDLYCLHCSTYASSSLVNVNPIPSGDIKIENAFFSLVINEKTKMLSSITNKNTGKTEELSIVLAAYATSQFRSGAYLFKPDVRQGENLSVFTVKQNLKEIIIISGEIFSEISVIFEAPLLSQSPNLEQVPGSFTHTIRLYHTGELESEMNKGIYIENVFDLGGSLNNRDIDLFMRFLSKIDNGRNPVFYTDSNGFIMQKRNKVEDIGIEGNYYPITTMAFIQNDESRLTLLVDHAQGASSWQNGWLEVMVDRRSSYDDSRGMGEGVLDSTTTTHKYWLLLEDIENENLEFPIVTTPSITANLLSKRLNYPSLVYFGASSTNSQLKDSLLFLDNGELHCNTHLLNLRTISTENKPSNKALLIFQQSPGDCSIVRDVNCPSTQINSQFFSYNFLKISRLTLTSLTGLNDSTSYSDFNSILKSLEPMSLTAVKVDF